MALLRLVGEIYLFAWHFLDEMIQHVPEDIDEQDVRLEPGQRLIKDRLRDVLSRQIFGHFNGDPEMIEVVSEVPHRGGMKDRVIAPDIFSPERVADRHSVNEPAYPGEARCVIHDPHVQQTAQSLNWLMRLPCVPKGVQLAPDMSLMEISCEREMVVESAIIKASFLIARNR